MVAVWFGGPGDEDRLLSWCELEVVSGYGIEVSRGLQLTAAKDLWG